MRFSGIGTVVQYGDETVYGGGRVKTNFMPYYNRVIQEEFFTTEYTEFHGGIKCFRIKTPWYSVTSVVNSYLFGYIPG